MVFTLKEATVTWKMSAAAIVSASLLVVPGYGQPADKTQTRPAAFDPAAIRREAAKLAELRALLADSDSNVRLLTIREVARSGDAAQRQIVIEAGLSSAEGALQEAALRAVLANIRQIVMQVALPDGKAADANEFTNLALTVKTFDPETGLFAGYNESWSGQAQGGTFAFTTNTGNVLGSLVWDAEAGEYRGTINTASGRASGARKASWRPR